MMKYEKNNVSTESPSWGATLMANIIGIPTSLLLFFVFAFLFNDLEFRDPDGATMIVIGVWGTLLWWGFFYFMVEMAGIGHELLSIARSKAPQILSTLDPGSPMLLQVFATAPPFDSHVYSPK